MGASARALLVVCFVFSGFVVATPSVLAACGDGVIDSGEDCDDGSSNNNANSCCGTNCKFNGRKPDVIVGDLSDTIRHGTLNGITAYSVGTVSCNLGSCWLKWISGTPEHPVIGQNMYRLKDGRFEQIGQSWLKHGFTALAGNVCGSCTSPGTGARLGVNCSDPYSASLNGSQGRLGPKVDVNPSTGVYPYPDNRIGTTGDVIFKRLQVHNTDLDPAQNPGATYFVEGQYVTLDDATAGNGANNASYRRITVGAAPNFSIALQGSTQRQRAGIQAWKDTDATVTEAISDQPGDGRFLLSAKATALGGGVYHYEYALQNLTSQRGAQSFSVPLPIGAVVTNIGFHDVDYHSGEPFDGHDWTATLGASSITWTTTPFATDPNANALRWGTLYNFRFDANVAPGSSALSVGFFKPGSPASFTITNVSPGSCTFSEGVCGNNADDDCDGQIDCADLDCCMSGMCAAGDGDGDNFPASCDCNDTNALIYPGAAQLCDGINNNCSAAGWPAVPADELDSDGDGVRVCGGDCDDANGQRFPGNTEACDGLDNDCADGVPAAEIDADGDGVRVCGGDCNDANPNIHPGRAEACDGLDNDCAGGVPAVELDADGDGVRVCAGDCDDANSSRRPGLAESCDGLDNDCIDGVPASESDADADGARICAGDCDDADPGRFPGNAEPCDGLDSDCNLLDSELDADLDGFRVCAGDCDDSDPQSYPGHAELCDGLDNDCNSEVPALEADADADGVRVCAGDCDDALRARAPGLDEICDGLDNDCDGIVPAGETDTDHDGTWDCLGDCDPANPTVWATPTEVRDLSVAYVDGVVTVFWNPPLVAGCNTPYYDTLRSTNAGDFVTEAQCIESDGTDTNTTDAEEIVGGIVFYLVRATNACPVGEGPLGTQTGLTQRTGRHCP